jgi:hypothetical protein
MKGIIVRELIRKIIKERLENFDDISDLGVDLLGDLDTEKKEKNQANVFAYSAVAIHPRGTVYKLLICFSSPDVMEEYILSFPNQNTRLDPASHMIVIAMHPTTSPEDTAADLFLHFPDAEVIKIHDYTALLNTNIDGSLNENWKNMYGGLESAEEKNDTSQLVHIKACYHLFDLVKPKNLSGFFLLSKDGNVTYTPK